MLRSTLLPLPMVSSQPKVVHARQLIRAADTFNHVLIGGNTSLLPLLMRAQIKAGLIGGEVQSLLVHAYRWLTILCALQVYVAGFGPDDISSAAVWFGPGQELLDRRVVNFSTFG